MRNFLFILCVSLVGFTSNGMADNGKIKGEELSLSLGQKFKLNSEVLGETREVMIHTPVGYDSSSDAYPVLYVLDGNNNFIHSISALKYLNRFTDVPEMIIVGITNNQGTRRRDLGIGRDKFRQYIMDEVVGFVEGNYRTSKLRSLFGHSMAGHFVLDTLSNHPEMFKNYIAASPAVRINGKVSYSKADFSVNFEKLFQNMPDGKSLYSSMGGAHGESAGGIDGFKHLTNMMQKTAPKSLKWHFEDISTHIHMTTPYQSMYDGLYRAFTN